MDENLIPRFGVSGFVELINQVLEFSCSAVEIKGEVASFKVNQGKWVFFDLKDEEASVGCFMPVYQLRTPIEDGMKLVVRAQPKVTKWGKFSVTVQNYRPRDVQKTGLLIKKKLRDSGTSLRLIPNPEIALNTAASHHNKLGLSPTKVELLVVRAPNNRLIIAESVGAQNITALAARDQARPRTDAFVGMLPPKLARMMINLSGETKPGRLWDPFCGTGTVLQEARLKGIDVYGSDLSQKMVDYATENMQWLDNKYQIDPQWQVFQADATDIKLNTAQKSEITRIVCEAYLGQPFSAPPKPAKLTAVRGNCNHIISQFLVNIRSQINLNTTLVVAVPAWRDHRGKFTHLPLIDQLADLGYRRLHLNLVSDEQLLYYRQNQVVAREILLLKPLDEN